MRAVVRWGDEDGRDEVLRQQICFNLAFRRPQPAWCKANSQVSLGKLSFVAWGWSALSG